MKTLSRHDSQPEKELLAPRAPEAGPLRGRVSRELRRALIDPNSGMSDEFHGIIGLPQDRVAPFAPVITAMRMATTAVSLLVAEPFIASGSLRFILCTTIVVVYAILRSFRPIIYSGDLASMCRVVAEVAIHLGVVVMTGLWSSPFVFCLITALVVAGFARGFAFALRVSATASVAISLPYVLLSQVTQESLSRSSTWSALLMLIAIVAGYGRRISGEADRERDLALDRLGRLADANALLYSLHRVAQTLPASLDMNEVLESTVSRLRGLVDFDAVLIMLFDDTDGHWQVIRQEGCHLDGRLGPTDLPLGMRQAITESRVVMVNDLGTQRTGPGFDGRSGSGLYGVLTARGSIMGLIALEHRDHNKFDHRAGGLLGGFIPPLALALDNARWFARLRTVGADEERTRIARDLHDRIGQSLAYLAFELDRIVARHEAKEEVGSSLDQLRGDVRGVIREVRDTLYDLRTDVSEVQSLPDTLRQYCDRVAERTTLRFEIDSDTDERLPILQEREMWRIAQEAVANVERHAQATSVTITWRCDAGRAAVRISDDGRGFDIGRAGRLDSYGMLGMRERASSIGAMLEVHSTPGHGTSITCVLDPSSEANRLPQTAHGGI